MISPHQPPNSSTQSQDWIDLLILTSAALLVFGSTIFRGGNRLIPLTPSEWLGISIVLAWFLKAARNGPQFIAPGHRVRRWSILALATLPVWIAILQLTIMPFSRTWTPISIHPLETKASLLAGAPIVALFLCALRLEDRAVKILCKVWLGVALCQGVLGLFQLGGFELLSFGMVKSQGSAGTFANRNHFASFMAMSIPMGILMLKNSGAEKDRESHVSWMSVAMLFVLVAALFASLSRTGLVVGLTIAIAASWLLWAKSKRRGDHRSWAWSIVPLLSLIALTVGGLEWLSRFDTSQLEASAHIRELNRVATWKAAVDHFPFGSGMGTFSDVFPQYQSMTISASVNYAHNEYVQWFLELGILFPIILAIALPLVFFRWCELMKHRDTLSQMDRLSVAAGLGVVAIALHAWVDFPLRIPANAMLAAFLLGVFLREPVPSSAHHARLVAA